MHANVIFSTVNISRNIIRSYARMSKLNPGIQKRLKVLREKEPSFEDDVEEFESDFMNLKESHKEHEREMEHFKDKEKFWIVKRKYFKEDKVNFLTWNDKEQIRYLHQSNPEEWTVDKLSEGFPALPDTIKKIIKNKWHAKNDSKIKHHDQAVEQNWKNLKSGKLSDILTRNLINHLIKFSPRKAQTNLESRKLDSENRTDFSSKEFSSIITNFERITEPDENKQRSEIYEYCKKSSVIENKLKSYGKKSVTLNVAKGENMDNRDKMTFENHSQYLSENILDESNLPQKFETVENKVSTNFKTKENTNLVTYPEKIKIPKDKYKKGFTYKVNDCYYDDDGEFLYRVPGMY